MGIMILTKHLLQAVERRNLEEDHELMWIEIPAKGDPTLFGLFYCPPNESAYDFDCFALLHITCCLVQSFYFSVVTSVFLILSGVHSFPVLLLLL